MKKLAVFVVIAVAGLVVFNYATTGEFSVVPSFAQSEQEQKVADLQRDFDAASQQYAQAHRTAAVGGIDTTAEADAAIRSVKQIGRELTSLKNSLSEKKALRRADELTAAVRSFEQGL